MHPVIGSNYAANLFPLTNPDKSFNSPTELSKCPAAFQSSSYKVQVYEPSITERVSTITLRVWTITQEVFTRQTARLMHLILQFRPMIRSGSCHLPDARGQNMVVRAPHLGLLEFLQEALVAWQLLPREIFFWQVSHSQIYRFLTRCGCWFLLEFLGFCEWFREYQGHRPGGIYLQLEKPPKGTYFR